MREVCSLMDFSFPLFILWKILHSSPLRCSVQTGHPSPLYGFPQVRHVADCSIFYIICEILWYSITFYYMYLHPWTPPSSHSLHCWMSTRPSILSPQVSITLSDSRSIIISSQTHSIQLPTFFIPSKHLLASSDALSFHSAFMYAHHMGKSIKTVIHSFKKKKN